VLVDRLRAPVALFDFLNLLLTEPEVMPDLVNQRLADHGTHFVVVLAVLLDRPLINRDAVRQRVAPAPRTLRQRRALIQPVKRVGRLDLHFREELRARLLLDDEREVLDLAAEAARDEPDGFSDESFERGAVHSSVTWSSSRARPGSCVPWRPATGS